MTSFDFGDIISIKLKNNSEADVNTGYAVIISAEVINRNLQSVIVCPLISADKVAHSRIGATFIPKVETGLNFDCVAFSLQILTVPKTKIKRRIGSLPNGYIRQIKESLQAVLDIYP